MTPGLDKIKPDLISWNYPNYQKLSSRIFPPGARGGGSLIAGYVLLASQNPYPIIVYFQVILWSLLGIIVYFWSILWLIIDYSLPFIEEEVAAVCIREYHYLWSQLVERIYTRIGISMGVSTHVGLPVKIVSKLNKAVLRSKSQHP